MLTGRRAFEGETSLESISSILKDEPQPISQILPEVPGEIERIVHKTLRKDRQERYQTAKDLLTDLKSAKHDLEIHDSLERSAIPNREANETQSLPTATTDETQNQSTLSETLNQLTSSAEYIVAQVKNHKFIYLALAVLLIAGIGFGIYRYRTIQPTNIPFQSVKITKITDSGRVLENVALSRDGKWLVYSIFEKEGASVWLKQVAVPESDTQIVPPAAVRYREFTFSPDGNYLYYSVEGEPMSNCTVYQIPMMGGTARKVVSGVNGGIRFSPDGKQITYGVENLEDDESIRLLGKILREARDYDVWKFTTPQKVWRNWDAISKHLGRRQEFWKFLFEFWDKEGLLNEKHAK